MKTLKEKLEANAGNSTYIATLGTNANGGALVRVDDLLEDAGVLANYKQVPLDASEFERHIEQAGGPYTAESPIGWEAYDNALTDKHGYLTGAVNRVYVFVDC